MENDSKGGESSPLSWVCKVGCKKAERGELCFHVENELPNFPSMRRGKARKAGKLMELAVKSFSEEYYPDFSFEYFQDLLASYGYAPTSGESKLLCARYFYRKKQKDIARDLGITALQVCRRLKRLRQELKAKGFKRDRRRSDEE